MVLPLTVAVVMQRFKFDFRYRGHRWGTSFWLSSRQALLENTGPNVGWVSVRWRGKGAAISRAWADGTKSEMAWGWAGAGHTIPYMMLELGGTQRKGVMWVWLWIWNAFLHNVDFLWWLWVWSRINKGRRRRHGAVGWLQFRCNMECLQRYILLWHGSGRLLEWGQLWARYTIE